jgi:CBS-domain-containing membrane protein
MEYLSAQAYYPLMLVPFGTSIVLVMGMPDAAPSRPRALVGGHLVSALVGLQVSSWRETAANPRSGAQARPPSDV